MNNSFIATADRVTHLKIVAVSLVAAIMVVAVGITARPNAGDSVTARLKADAPVLQPYTPIPISKSFWQSERRSRWIFENRFSGLWCPVHR